MNGSPAAGAALRMIGDVLAGMPDPGADGQARALQTELTEATGTRHAVAVSSGTAALHAALTGHGIGPGDEVLLPAVSVIMPLAAITVTGARPVLVDAGPGGEPVDLADLTAKITSRSRVVLPVHFAGRLGDMAGLLRVASDHGLAVIEDACQAQGSRYRGRLAGTLGLTGCFSLKDGKLASCGEGGYLLTSDPGLAGRAAAFRNHGTPPGATPATRTRLGLNYRLAEPLAAIARASLARLGAAITERRRQTRLLTSLTGEMNGLEPVPVPAVEQPNGYAALWRISLDDPRGFCKHLAACGVPNSTGSFGFRALSADPACRSLHLTPCPRAEELTSRLLAVPVTSRTTDGQIAAMAATIAREARRWAP
jgi:dTDP-4-amino-4,6-dideoxygalactose transaminase